MKPFSTTVMLAVALAGAVGHWAATYVSAERRPQTPHIDSVRMADPQPHEDDPAVIWYDDFDDDSQQKQYPEKSGKTTDEVRFGETGKSLRMHYPQGGRGIGKA